MENAKNIINNEEMNKEINQHIEQLNTYFTRHIPFSADSEFIALRAHLLAEYYLNHLLIITLGSGEIGDIENLSFHQKIIKLKESKNSPLKDWVVKALFKLNKIVI